MAWLVTTTPIAILGLESFELRRLHLDLIYTYKTIFGLIDINCSKFFTVSPYSSTWGHDYKLLIQYSRVDARKYFWSNRVVHAWNLLYQLGPAT